MTPHRQSREETARIEIGRTDSTRGVNWFLALCFLGVITAVPLIRNVAEFRDILAGKETGRRLPQCWDPFRFLLPTPGELRALIAPPGRSFGAAKAINRRMQKDIADYEADLKSRDRFIERLVPWVQVPITGWLKGGNEDAYCGRGNWLFYRRDIDALTGPGFLDATVLKARAKAGSGLSPPLQPDPVEAILAFRAQLAERGVALLVVPVPGKPSIHPERFSARYERAGGPVSNPSYAEFLARLRAAGVAICDLAPVLWAEKARLGRPVYLAADTHWTPEGMEAAARAVAAAAAGATPLPRLPAPGYRSRDQSVTGLGDSAGQLGLPAGYRRFPAETVTTHPVDAGTQSWRPDPRADVLLLGDSFSNIYSLPAMGWGESAGLPERISLHLTRPVNAILRNDAGAHATRRMLADELSRGRNRLDGKKLVIWEFAARELAFGDWRRIPLQDGEPRPSAYYVPPAGARITVSGTVRAVAPAPRPGSVPYRDHLVMACLSDLDGTDSPAQNKDAVVFVWSMRGNVWTPAARWRPGDRVSLVLRPWNEAARGIEAINRTELNDDGLMEAEPCWGEVPETGSKTD